MKRVKYMAIDIKKLTIASRVEVESRAKKVPRILAKKLDGYGD